MVPGLTLVFPALRVESTEPAELLLGVQGREGPRLVRCGCTHDATSVAAYDEPVQLSVAFHELEQGGYDADIADLCDMAAKAGQRGEQVLELGAGVGRLAIPMARHADVTALDLDPDLLAELRRRWIVSGSRHGLSTHCADATTAWGEPTGPFGLIVAATSFVQIIGGKPERAALLGNIRDRLTHKGVAVLDVMDMDDVLDDDDQDCDPVSARVGRRTLHSRQLSAIDMDDGFVELTWARSTGPWRRLARQPPLCVRYSRLTPKQLAAEARSQGLRARIERRDVPGWASSSFVRLRLP